MLTINIFDTFGVELQNSLVYLRTSKIFNILPPHVLDSFFEGSQLVEFFYYFIVVTILDHFNLKIFRLNSSTLAPYAKRKNAKNVIVHSFF